VRRSLGCRCVSASYAIAFGTDGANSGDVNEPNFSANLTSFTPSFGAVNFPSTRVKKKPTSMRPCTRGIETPKVNLAKGGEEIRMTSAEVADLLHMKYN
jgi:hypothetical protein